LARILASLNNLDYLRRDLRRTVRMAASTGNLGFIAAGVFTRLAAELVARIASARNVRALLTVCLCHKTSSILRVYLQRDPLVA
jgi:hypothetical protein